MNNTPSLPPVLNQTAQLTSLNARTTSKVLEVTFDDGQEFTLPFELMRVYSPSAEVRGHGVGQAVLQTGKRDVGLLGLEPIGNYAVKPLFDDGHSSGLFTWDYLYWLGQHQSLLWSDYITRLQAAGFEGETGRDVQKTVSKGKNCHS